MSDYEMVLRESEYAEDIQEAEQRGYERAMRLDPDAKQIQFRLGVKAAREAVLRLNKPWARAYMDTEVLAAIDAITPKEEPL